MKRLAIFIVLLLPACAWANSTGYNNPSAYQFSTGWVNPTYGYTSNNSRATHNRATQDTVCYETFGFSVTTGSTIDSVLVKLEGYADNKTGDYRVLNVGICADARTGALTGSYQGFELPQEEDVVIVKYPGTSLTVSIVNTIYFGVNIRRYFNDDNVELLLDAVFVNVYYTPPSMSQVISAIDTNTTDIKVKDVYTLISGCIVDSSYFQISDDNWSTFDTTKIASPTNPDTNLFESLTPDHSYKIRVISFGCETDTSNVLSITTLPVDVTHSVAFYDSASTTLSVYDDYTDDLDADTLRFVIDDDASIASPLEVDTLIDPTDPDSTIFTGLTPATQYYVWAITSKGNHRDTSSSINRYTKHIKFTSHAVVETTHNSVKIEAVLADTTGAVDYLYLKLGTSNPPAYKDTIIAGDACDTFEVFSLLPSTKYYYQVVVKDENYRDSTAIDSVTTISTPTTAPDSLMMTTFYSEHWDPDGYGFKNPDPDNPEQGLVTYEPWLSARTGSAHSAVYLYDLKVLHNGSLVWTSGWVNLGDTIDGGTRCPKVQYSDSTGRRFHPGYEYTAMMRFKSASVTSDWTSPITFTGVMPYESALPKWRFCATLSFNNNHDAVSNWVPLSIIVPTGEGQLITSNSLRDGTPNIYRNPKDGFIYLSSLEKSSIYSVTGTGGSYQGEIRKLYDADTSTWTEGTIYARLFNDVHSVPMLAATDSSLHIFISGHNNPSVFPAYYFRCDSSIAGQGYSLDQITGGAGIATGGAATALYDTSKTTHWKTNQLKNWWIQLRPGITTGDATYENKEIISNTGETLQVASAWTDNPANGDNYFIYYVPDAFDWSTYSFPITMPNDSVYVFFRVDGDEIFDDSTGTATGGSSNTLVNSGKSYTVNAFKGWHIVNTSLDPDEEKTIASNTATTFTIEGTWDTDPVNGNTYTMDTPHKGFLCYTILDPYADSINVAFSDPYIVMNYNDAPEWLKSDNAEPVIYASAFHNDYYDNDDVYILATFWDQYGVGVGAVDQGGSGITVLKSTLDDGLFKTWTNLAGDTIGYAFQDNLYHTDSTINKAACDVFDTCYGVATHDSLFIGASNQPSLIVADTLGNVHVVYFKFYDDNYASCSMHHGRHKVGGNWELTQVTGTEDSLINLRTGGQESLQDLILKIYGGVFSDTTAEVKCWRTNVNDITPTFSSVLLTSNSASGMGRMATLQYVPAGNNRRIAYSRNRSLYEMIDRDWQYWGSDYPTMRTDGDDAWIVLRTIDSLGTITNSFLNRRAAVTFQARETQLDFTSFLTIDEDSTRINTDVHGNDYIFQYYYGNRNVDSCYSQRTHVTQGIYKQLYSFEEYASGYDLDDAAAWVITTDSATVLDRLGGRWIWGLQDGLMAVYLTQGATAKLASVPTLSVNYNFGCYLFSNTFVSTRGFLCFYSANGFKKFGIGKYDVSNSGYIYDFGDGITLSDSTVYPEGPTNIEFRVTDLMPTGNYGILARSDGVTIATSDVSDTLETGAVTTGDDDKIIDANGNWVADSRNGMTFKITSGTYNDSTREILDTKIDTLIFTPAFGGNLGVGVSYTIWDTATGITLPLDSVTIECDTGSVYMDFVYRQKDYKREDTLTTILSIQGEYPLGRGSIIIGGD